MAPEDARRDDRGRRQRQARALGDPTRFAIFCEVLDAPGPVRISTLTERFGLNHNAIRQHVAKLVDAGLVQETIAPRQGPGRPALQYRVTPEAAAAWASESPYQQLALLLLDVARGNGTPAEVGATAGRKIPVVNGEDPVSRLTHEMARRGFRPQVVPGEDGFEIVLEHCPFQAAAAVAPELICSIHRGLAEGMLEVLGGDYELQELVVRDPDRAGCRIRVRPAPSAELT